MRTTRVPVKIANEHRPASLIVTRERLAELTTILERRIAERAVAPAALGVLAKTRALLLGRADR